MGGTYDNEMDYLKTWLTNRLDWMDSKWLFPLNTRQDLSSTSEFKVYPNPFSSRINLSITTKNPDEIVVDIYNLQGQKMTSHKFHPFTISSSEITIDDIFLKPGIYILQVVQSGQLIAVLN